MSQKGRVLKSLERAGRRGVTQADWSGVSGTPDGGPPITRLAARVLELQNDGHRIINAGRRDKCRVYALGETTPVEAPPEFGEPFAAELFRLEDATDSRVLPAIYREAA